MARKSTSAAVVASNVVELESAAIAAAKGIESSYGAASSAILAYTLACKSAKVLPPVFDAGIARIAEAAPGIALISVRGYVSNARRIWACDADKLAEVRKTTNGLQSIAKACPSVSKNGGAGVSKKADKADDAPVDPKAPSTPAVKTPEDPIVSMANALVALRRMANGKKKARIILATVGEIEDMLDEIKSLMSA